MKVTNAEKKEKSTVELTVEVSAEEFEAAVQKAYIKNRKKISVPGFRKGKAPRKIIEGMYGSGIFYEDAINDVYPAAYDEALADQKLEEVGYPKMEIVNVGKEGFTFKALVPVRPEVKLGTYKGLTAPRVEPKVTAKDVDDEIKPFIERATRLVSVNRKAKKGDTAVIDFEGFDDGVAFEGGKGENFDLKLGAGMFVPGFEEQVIGMKAGEEKDLDITFPKDYQADLAGKSVVFHVKVNEVKEPQVPEIDDEFAKDVSEFDTLEAFRKDLEEKLLRDRAKEAEGNFEHAIMDQLVDGMECEIPDGMIDAQTDQQLEEFGMQLQGQGITLEKYSQMFGMSMDSMRASIRPGAVRRLQEELALSAVAEAEGIEVTEKDYEDAYAELAKTYNLDVEKVRQAVELEGLKKNLLRKKAHELVIKEAKVGKAKKTAAKKADAKEKAEKKPAEKKTAKKSEDKSVKKTETKVKTEKKAEPKKTATKTEKKAEPKKTVKKTEKKAEPKKTAKKTEKKAE